MKAQKLYWNRVTVTKCITIMLVATALFFIAGPGARAQHRKLPPGTVETILALTAGDEPEGVAVTHDGKLYVGNRWIGETTVTNEILRVKANGTFNVVAQLPSSTVGVPGLLGLAVDNVGNIYAALASFDLDTQGVWRVSKPGGGGSALVERLPGSENIIFPNALTFDCDENLYATDSTGAIWRAPNGGAFTLWVSGFLLEPLPEDPFGTPLPGANGIAFSPADNTIYFANTEQSLIGRVAVQSDGGAGTPESVTAPFAVLTVDGIAVDVEGNIHAVLPGFSVLGTAPLVKVSAATGMVIDTVVDPDEAAKFDTPASITFAGGRLGVKTVFVTNADLPLAEGGPGPGVVHVGVGVPGVP